MDAIDLIRAARLRREANGLVAKNGVACPTRDWVDYYDARDSAPRDAQGRIPTTPALRALRKRAEASTDTTR